MKEAKGFIGLHRRIHVRKFAIVMLLLAGCVSDRELLNSERIRQSFGSYGITVLPSTDTLRRASLYSLENGQPVTRTFAVVRFNDALTAVEKAAIQPVHAQILAGASIGATFREHHWTINKQNLYTGGITLANPDSEIASLMQVDIPRELAMHAYLFNINNDLYSIDYATIIEIHHPQYLNVATLRKLYPTDPGAALDEQQLSALRQLVRTAQ